MSFTDICSDGTLEECLDELNDFMGGLQRYAPTIVAVAMRVHLGTLLQALLEAQQCAAQRYATSSESWSTTRCRPTSAKAAALRAAQLAARGR
jgi:hypothetical protein